jgi:hypothetical protein
MSDVSFNEARHGLLLTLAEEEGVTLYAMVREYNHNSEFKRRIDLAALNIKGGYLESVTVIPLSSAGGAVTVLDGTASIIAIPAAAYAPQPLPITLNLGIRSQSTSEGGFKITTGSSVSCIAVGKFASD